MMQQPLLSVDENYFINLFDIGLVEEILKNGKSFYAIYTTHSFLDFPLVEYTMMAKSKGERARSE